jgi:hypothetical protein
MSDALHELRPRSTIELYDAALHLCVHTRSELPALALLGATPVAACGLWLVRVALAGESYGVPALLFVLTLVFRTVCQGAGALAATRELEGKPISALAAMKQSLARWPSFVVATAWIGLFEVVLYICTLGISIFFLSSQATGGPELIAEGSAHGWNFGKMARQRLRGRDGAVGGVRILHGVALLLLMVNLHTGLEIMLEVARSLLGVDVSFLDQFVSLSHAFYDLCLFAVAQVMLDPVRCAASALLLADARVRHEGFDLLASLRRIREAIPGSRSAALVLLTLSALLPARFAHADDLDDDDAFPPDVVAPYDAVTGPAQAAERLRTLAKTLDVANDPEVKRGLERVAKINPSTDEARSLARFADRIGHELSMSEKDQAKAELKQAMQLVEAPKPDAAGDPRLEAQRILEQPEFATPPPTRPDAPRESSGPGWWDRFWKWLRDLLRWIFEHEDKTPPPTHDEGPALTGDVARLLTYILIGVAAVVVLLGVAQMVRSRRLSVNSVLGGGGDGDGDGLDPEMNALSKPAAVWSADADLLAAQGRFREAIRALYLALLATFHRRGAIDYHPAQSNWDYCRHFRGQPEQLAPFTELTRRFDFAWYGRIGIDAGSYASFKELIAPLLAHEGPIDAHAIRSAVVANANANANANATSNNPTGGNRETPGA